jgi:uncharacterized membrane protein YfcA
VFLLHNADPGHFKLFIGILLTLYSLFGLLVRDPPRIEAGGSGLDAFAGLLGGVLGGLGGMSGTVPAIWTQLRGWKRDLRRATMQVYNIAIHCFTLTAYARTGTLDARAFHLFIVVAPAMLIPSYLGMRLYHRFSERTFERVVLALLLVSGLALIVGVTRAWNVR